MTSDLSVFFLIRAQKHALPVSFLCMNMTSEAFHKALECFFHDRSLPGFSWIFFK